MLNKKIAIFAVILLICIIFIVFIPKTNNTSVNDTSYCLKDENGKVTLYKGELFQQQFDIYVNSLPEYDRNLLKKGMYFENIDEVYRIIEDFDG